MLILEAQVQTERSSRYLVQRCRHVHKATRVHPQLQAHVEWSDDRGVISFDWGRCTLRGLPGVLTLRAEAPDEDAPRRAEHPRRSPRADRQTRSPGGDLDTAQRAGEATAETPARRDRAHERTAHGRHA
jgi:hypothetical protein